jgi:putative ABC transport system ATP-binding protein/lipoprotein-releasing system ATP-binding protein
MRITAQGISKTFPNTPRPILDKLDFVIPSGQFTAISGRSGSGKTTLLYILSSLDRPSLGQVRLDSFDPATATSKDLHEFRNQNIGFIFQFHYLLPELTALENILLPARRRHNYLSFESRARQLLDKFGLVGKADRLATQLSGGEQQRVAIARALVLSPKVIFADEPTGNLDSTNGQVIMDALHEIHRHEKTTIVLVTHEPDYSAQAEREIFLKDGVIERIR